MNLAEALELRLRALGDIETASQLPENQEADYNYYLKTEGRRIDHDIVPYPEVWVVTEDGETFNLQFAQGTYDDYVTYHICDLEGYKRALKDWGL